MKRFLLLLLIVLSASVLSLTVEGEPAEDEQEHTAADRRPFRVIAYLMSTRPPERVVSMPFEHLTDVIWFSVEPNADGTLNDALLFADKLFFLRRIAGEHGVRVHIAVGGWGRSEHFATVAKNDEKRAIFIKALTDLCLAEKLAGADIDWEFPRDESERAAATILLRDLRASFKPHGLELSIAVGGHHSTFDHEIFEHVNRVHIMSYDHHGPKHEPHSTFEHAQQDVTFWHDKHKLPAGKLLLGLPFYGRKLGEAGTIEFRQWSEKFDVADDVNEAGGYFVNNHALIRRKVKYAQEQGLGGVMIWELGHDRIDHRAILRTIGSAVASDKGETRENP